MSIRKLLCKSKRQNISKNKLIILEYIDGGDKMGQKLVIVESPAKAKTIKKYLGSNFVVEASMGHVRDLPKSQLGVDIDNNYQPKYITIRGKGELLDKLRKEAKKAIKFIWQLTLIGRVKL